MGPTAHFMAWTMFPLGMGVLRNEIRSLRSRLELVFVEERNVGFGTRGFVFFVLDDFDTVKMRFGSHSSGQYFIE